MQSSLGSTPHESTPIDAIDFVGHIKKFDSLEQAEAWQKQSLAYLTKLHTEVLAIEGVSYAETWLCGAVRSFIAGFADNDEMIVCVPI